MTQKKLTGYGPIIKCIQCVPWGQDPFYFDGCLYARVNRIFRLPDENNEVSTLVKVNPRCNQCQCNQGSVNIFWEEEELRCQRNQRPVYSSKKL